MLVKVVFTDKKYFVQFLLAAMHWTEARNMPKKIKILMIEQHVSGKSTKSLCKLPWMLDFKN